MKKLTKSDFLTYLDSPMHLWALKNVDIKKNLTPFESHLIEQGYKVENEAKTYLERYVLNKPEYNKIIWQKTYCNEKCTTCYGPKAKL